MRYKKEGPTAGTEKAQKFIITQSYSNNSRLSMAVQILLIIAQAPDHADRLRQTCFDQLDHILRLHYTEGRAGV